MTTRITGGDGFRLANKSKNGREVVILTEPLRWGVESPDGPNFVTVPEGFESDFASVPWVARRLIPSFGPWAKAAVLHDYLYVTLGEGGKWTRKQSDDMFLQAMTAIADSREDGEPKRLTRSTIHRAVRAFGAGGWGS